jgi:hypothetical protein
LKPVTDGWKQVAGITSGKNSERALQSWATRQPWRKLLPELYEWSLPLAESWEVRDDLHAALLPHEVFGSMHSEAPDLFECLLTGGDNNLREYWDSMAQCDPSFVANHPVVVNHPDPTKRVPLGMHGDDAGMSGQESVLAITWGSLAGCQSSTFDTRIAFSMVKTRLVTESTMDDLYLVLQWSFEALATGRYPYNDHRGRPFALDHHPKRFARRGKLLAGGFVGAWAEMRGDWKYLREALKLKHHYNCHQHICHLCGVMKATHHAGMLYTNFRQDALHRQTLVSHNGFMGSYATVAAMSMLFLIPGFCIWRVHFDYMHTHDLGTLQHAVPSVMRDLTDRNSIVFVGATRQQKLNDAYRKYRVWCKQTRTRSIIGKPFKEKVWCKTKYPRISQLPAKAAALRSMTYWLNTVTEQHTSCRHDATRAIMIRGFVEADRTCRRAGRFLTRQEHAKLCDNMAFALVSYNALAQESFQLGTKLYKVVPKFHAATHIYDSLTNPRAVHCYADEDMVGRLKKIFSTCHGSTAPLRSLQRYCMLVGLRWWCLLHDLRGLPYE